MATHFDADHREEFRKKILDELRIRSEVMSQLGKNSHASAAVLEKWHHDDIEVCRKENDPNDVLRISIGGHPDIERSEYCNFRGDQSKCIALLERALVALKQR